MARAWLDSWLNARRNILLESNVTEIEQNLHSFFFSSRWCCSHHLHRKRNERIWLHTETGWISELNVISRVANMQVFRKFSSLCISGLEKQV